MLMRIGGVDAEPGNDSWIPVINPATGDEIDRVPEGTKDDVERAVAAADAAFFVWKKKTQRERGMILFRAAGIVREQHKDLARLLTTEQGKPLRESIDEIRGFANILEFYAGISGAQNGELVRLGATGDALVTREPLGICGAIIPWNMPVLIMGWKVGPALLAGNTLVLKPASSTPLTTLRLTQILDTVGLSPGTLNIITGPGETVGEAIAEHPSIKKLSFTGNYATGQRIRERAAGSIKELTLELGGSDPMIVMPDADINKAVDGAIRGRFYNAGQTCTAVKRLFVHESIATEFSRKLKQNAEALRLGNGLDTGTDMGPLNSAIQRERIEILINKVQDAGQGTILTGGTRPEGAEYSRGFFFRPTVVSDVEKTSGLLTGEVFGPVLPVVPVPDLDTAITEANRTSYGLGASIWTNNLHTAKRAFDEIHAGIIWVNRHLTVPPEIPFGGMNESGLGRENGLHALESYSRTKTLLLGW
ncbi:aldehyde dehydrogenase family protein [Methanoregula formicica]|uniref:NAD-dependent aldehyde dehydrogenase n=1 Tax=Methanoregula formicica (strain DSM 22288 / NBRC 105244 / SMSP) TaxID=593750 RepID=L0HI10_METFS|nr:aldehyde dehydrogenase family protein [Methanoregula formicica]AGB02694.1 NAD-dependent aldehyde dehydrogenase [Methanoregula formicica SMSP]